METDKPTPKALQECEDKLKELEAENQHLREASHAFGQLAERLNMTLQQERRAGSDRRERPRQYAERRQSRELASHTPHEPE